MSACGTWTSHSYSALNCVNIFPGVTQPYNRSKTDYLTGLMSDNCGNLEVMVPEKILPIAETTSKPVTGIDFSHDQQMNATS